MGNYITYRPFDVTGKVILSDGTVHEFHKPLTVAELMLEHPQQVVVELRSAVSEKRPQPLPSDEKLEIRKVYVMVPMKRGKPASLSLDDTRHVLLSANSVLRSRSLLSSSKFLPLFAKICPAMTIEEHRFVQLNKSNKEIVEERSRVKIKLESEFLPEMLDGRPEYFSRQLSGKGWKPSLDTIKEKKVSHCWFQKGFILSN